MEKLKHCSIFMCLAILLIITFIFSDMASAIALQVAPHRFVFRIDQSNTQETIVTNVSDKAVRFKIYTEVATDQAPEQYLGDWVIVYPRLVSLNPGDQKVIRFSVRPPNDLEDGEYRCYLYVEELYDKSAEATEVEGVLMNFQLLTKIGINLYGQTGNITHRGNLKDVEIECIENQLTIKGDFVNLGNSHLLTDVSILIFDSNRQLVIEDLVRDFAVHRDLTKTFEYVTEFAQKGKYTIKMVFNHDEETIFTYQDSFEI
ncbi:MAG: fimbria/pilus periplasmic chaperone [Halanaerobiales bacterium]|nr:fimbria/pilus periplasmic chaperone [Halanaerobiales bacterium]